jgi:DNA-binding transcriptional ArsR family regulator
MVPPSSQRHDVKTPPNEEGGSADPQLVKALSHPLRARALPLFADGPISPNQVAKRLKVDVTSLAYHVRVLRELGCIELVETKQRRGALEHFYRAAGPALQPRY